MILFLDIDGVLHPKPVLGRSGETDLFCSLHLLEDVLREAPHVQVVISSSWREHHPLDEIREYFSPDLRERIVGATPLPPLASMPEHLADFPRQAECAAWLARYRPPGTTWLAIDDMAEDFAPRCAQLLLIDGSVGLTSESATELLRGLRGRAPITTPNQLRAAYPYLFAGPLFESYRGWFPLVARMCQQVDAAVRAAGGEHSVQLYQIREKFGVMNVQWTASETAPPTLRAEISRAVDEAVSESEHMCIVCGRPGQLHGLEWVLTLCPEHAALRKRDARVAEALLPPDGD